MWRTYDEPFSAIFEKSDRSQLLDFGQSLTRVQHVGVPPNQETELAEQLRAFNRFFTERIGALDDQHEGLDVTLGESRLMFTIRELDSPQPSELAERLELDLAYTSRMLGRLDDRGHIKRSTSPLDRRQRIVELTPSGRRLMKKIEQRSNMRVLGIVDHLKTSELTELTDAMNTIEHLLTKETP